MTWLASSRKLRIQGEGCADMTRMLAYLTAQGITDVLSQVRIAFSQNNARTQTRGGQAFLDRAGARETIEHALRRSRTD